MQLNSHQNTSADQSSSSPFLGYQIQILTKVSRTFALTIPYLPTQVRYAIGNAYLLCRIADTIEDEPQLSPERKRNFLDRFAKVVNGRLDADSFAFDLSRSLSDATPLGERDLASNTFAVVDYHKSVSIGQRKPIERCIESMCGGMAEFLRTGASGLPNMKAVEHYCYVVAGVVGEMITEILCDYSHDVESRRGQLLPLSKRFGRGLQLVNILKDHREDRQRGVSWLPQRILNMRDQDTSGGIEASLDRTILHVASVAQRDLESALQYVALIPVRERGVRRFLSITLGLAVLTLQRILSNPSFRRGEDVKISRRQVYAIVAATSAAARSNSILIWLFNQANRHVPTAAYGL